MGEADIFIWGSLGLLIGGTIAARIWVARMERRHAEQMVAEWEERFPSRDMTRPYLRFGRESGLLRTPTTDAPRSEQG